MPAKLLIQSSAKISVPFVRALIFGIPDQGKSMALVTAPKPIWLLTEPTCAGSLSEENIVAALGKPTPAEITEYVKKTNPGISADALKKAVADPSTVTEMTGITYDMPRLSIEDFTHLKEAIEILKSGQWQTVCIDSGTMLSKLLLEHFKARGGKGGTALKDPRQAYKKAADESLAFIDEIFKLPMHIVITAHAAERMSNKGTVDEPVWVPYRVPSFEGNVLGREIPHKIREIWQAQRCGTHDDGKAKFILRTRKQTEDGYERTLCPRLADEEAPDLSAIFAKILNN